MKTLIAEDNVDDRKLLRMNLEHHGCEVFEAGDGVEALRITREQKPGLIISDALMPNMDGFQFLRAVKTDESLRDIPFIFYSAVYTGHREAELATTLGAAAFIIKPKEPEELWTEIKGLLEECRFKDEGILTARIIEDDEFLTEYSRVVALRLEKKVKELEKAKALIEAKEQEWQTTFDAISDCVTIHDMDFNVVLANKGCEKVFGIALEEIRAKKCFELFHWSDSPHESCPRISAEKSKSPSEAEFFEPALNRWLSVSCYPLFESNGDVRGVVHFARDISERKRSEEKLQLFRSLMDRSIDAFFVMEPDTGRIIDVDEQACQSLGYTRAELLEKRVSDIEANIPTGEAWQAHVQEVKQAGSVIFEGVHRRRDGSVFPVEISVSYIRLLKTDYMMAVARDITERKQEEKEKKRLEAQLRQAQKMEAVGQLTGGIAHDFNNILSAIVGYGGLLQMKMKEDDPLRPDVDNILAASERAAALTQSLLAFSRKQTLNPKPISLNGIVKRMQNLLGRVIGEDINFNSVLAHEDCIVMADSGQIDQVLMNLATNARDAMPQGGNLTIETSKIEFDEEDLKEQGYGRPGTYALLSISDTGIGMDEKTRNRIFEPFFTTKEVGKGTGLGLAMVYGIIKQHNGFVNCYSEPGKGTTMRIYLPLHRTAAYGRETKVEPRPLPQRGTETVLIAEDDEQLRKLAVSVLREFGYEVISASDGEDAVEKFREHKEVIQLVILDVIMPRKNGKQAFDEIQVIKPGQKVIFTSGYTAEVVHQRGLLAEGMPFITKPVSPLVLLEKIRELLDAV